MELKAFMPYRLKQRQKQIPNGFKFVQPETGWQAPRFASFDVIVNSLINHRKARPDLIAAKGWKVDRDSVAEEVDAYNALLCARHGWMDYISDGQGEPPPPKPQALLQQEKSAIAAAAGKAKKIWAGLRTITDWTDSGAPPVPKEKSEARATICAKCPHNGQGDFTSWFTRPAADAILKNQEKLKAMRLSTTHDAKLNICEVCLCPLKLKVHTPVEYIKAHMSPEVLASLKGVPNCWIPKELEV